MECVAKTTQGMGNKVTVSCHSCGAIFADYKELALHILSSRKEHRKGKKWASKYIMLRGKRDKPDFQRTPLTEEQKESKKEMKRELSGENKTGLVFCPHCKTNHQQSLPVEYVDSPTAWRIKKMLVILCSGCGR